jgi:hypothetical protein
MFENRFLNLDAAKHPGISFTVQRLISRPQAYGTGPLLI